LACPFFVPTEKAHDIAFPHPARLPLGAAWRGTCAAPGHEGETLGGQELERCNLGYAMSCSRLPAERACDAVRFGVVRESATNVLVQIVFEERHRPAGGELAGYDLTLRAWSSQHSDIRVRRQAECFMQAYLERKARTAGAGS